MGKQQNTQQPVELTDEEIRREWFSAGGRVHGPHVETITMPEAQYFDFRRAIADRYASQVQPEPVNQQMLAALKYAVKQVPELATVPGIAAAIAAAEAAQPVASCTNSDAWNCKYCRKTMQCEALKDPRNFGQPATPPNQPVAVPEPKVGRTSDPLKLAYWDGWNECRAAMLSAAQQTEGGE